MPETLIKSRLHSNKHKPKNKQEIKILNQIYLHIFNHSSRNYYKEAALLNINKLYRLISYYYFKYNVICLLPIYELRKFSNIR